VSYSSCREREKLKPPVSRIVHRTQALYHPCLMVSRLSLDLAKKALISMVV
jgi:hypothetical protein